MTELPQPYRLYCLAEHIRAETKKTIEGIVTIGKDLIEAQSILKGEGMWVQWLRDEFEWSHQTAYNFINAANLVERYPILAHRDCTMSAIYLLASSTDDEIEQVITGVEGRITRSSALSVKARKWTDAVEELLKDDYGAAYHAIEKAMQDTNLHSAAMTLFTKHEEVFAALSGEDVPTVQKDVGMSFDERNPKPGSLPPQCQLTENEQGVHIVVWIDDGNDKKVPYMIASFPRRLPPAAMAYRNAALHGAMKEAGVRPWEFEAGEML